MKQLLTQGIILRRTDYGEADRIITLLTPEYGKLTLLARGVRKIKSKLAGGIELFSVSQITFIQGRGEVGTLVSSRLEQHYGHIVKDINRTMLAYELIEKLHKATEDNPESAYFELLQQAFMALDDLSIGNDIIALWFNSQMLRLAGHSPNLATDTSGAKLAADARYGFSFDAMTFEPRNQGAFGADAIKFLRLVFSNNQPVVLMKIHGVDELSKQAMPLVQTMSQQYIH